MTTRQLSMDIASVGAPPEGFGLRDYQRECIRALARYGLSGGKRALVALPTGTGKTVIFSEIAGTAKKKVLVLAHREELLAQARDKILRSHPHLVVELDQAEKKASGGADIVIGSVQTYAVGQGRLRRWQPGDFSAVIVDEAHHATARSFLEVLGHFGLVPNIRDLTAADLSRRNIKDEVKARFDGFRPSPDAPFLAGFTATPSRTDGQGLEYVFDEIVFSRSIRQMMEDGWLCPIRAIRVQTSSSIAGVKTRAGDFQESALSKAVNTEDRNALAVNAYRQYAGSRQALVFCVDVDHTKDMVQAFRAGGVSAEMVVGSKKDMEKPREQVIAEYQRGEVQVLCNCMVLTEGFDAPETSCIIMARPTKSSLLYTQMLGRGTRIAESKEDMLVIDLVDIAKAGVSSVNTLFGLPPGLESGSDVLSTKRQVEEMENSVPLELFEGAESIEQLELAAKQFDPLTAAQIEPWLDASMAWVRTSFGVYTLSLFEGEQLGVVEDMLGRGELRLKTPRKPAESLGTHPNVQKAIEAAEDWVRSNRAEQAFALDAGASWRKDSPTEKQLELAARLRIQVAPGMTKGDVSALIDSKLAKRG